MIPILPTTFHSHPHHHRSCSSLGQEKIITSLNHHMSGEYFLTWWKIHVGVSSLGLNDKRTFEMSSFPPHNSICYFFQIVSEVLMPKISISRFSSHKPVLIMHTHSDASSPGEERFQRSWNTVEETSSSSGLALTHQEPESFSFQSWSCEIFFDFLISLSFSIWASVLEDGKKEKVRLAIKLRNGCIERPMQ